MKKKICIIFLIFLLVVCGIFNGCYAIDFNKDILKQEIEKLNLDSDFLDSMDLGGFEGKITVNDDTIESISQGENITISYTLDDNIVLKNVIDVDKNITIDDFAQKYGKYYSMILCIYAAIAHYEGIEYEDSIMYLVSNAVTEATELMSLSSKDLDNITDSEVQENAEDNTLSKYFSDELTLNDNKNNVYTFSIKNDGNSDESLKLTSTFTINLNSDFSVLKNSTENFLNSLDQVLTEFSNVFENSEFSSLAGEYSELFSELKEESQNSDENNLQESNSNITDQNIAVEAENNNTENSQNNTQSTVPDGTQNAGKIPHTGLPQINKWKIALEILLFVIMIYAIYINRNSSRK